MNLIDGNKISAEVKDEIALEVTRMKERGEKVPHLAALIVGHDGASETYVGNKEKACKQVGFDSTVIRFEESVTEKEILEKVNEFNNNPSIDGFIIQLPLPKHISEQKVIEAIDPRKDVDGFHPINLGRMVIGLPAYVSATPAGIIELFKRYKIETSGKNVVVIGRSNIVGKPISILLSQKASPGDATVTLTHSRTKNLKEVVSRADIVIAALGNPEFLTADMVKDGAVVIDVGITRVKSEKTKSGWKLIGDVKFDEVSQKASFITPVPGGVGLMTIVSLLQNTLKAAKGEIYPKK
ncbi:MAG: bifunctional 5,10-methylene-tetrahydrofolate dehydrogenase/5,10-methylene-tetrahydrofolate cyclohydrolase [Bacteroidetes bacterium GWC2_33_15]|nr:MAG: bifunctional 5,10-methylene-tetrahydrofolate dehydrogenase/5,10-methylene-tetrahydrofolate cyclohydrolase [Bacteroidetes bacterium GWA2_33_15]OFX50371.1 MAG: bifunctional 5,10-methylene-tetrahydrofolate dehydrogenase/5,10-methylene-tetrahydrofolate cyclohydrolase [Bacteroidetes bacterium GWC2_33_15]OFX66712.1 MAG: bifunctional 5,10-methylene-tetrahydrofolate dehydrogenase/5,10-methylene-tetrahydrofolate cyclohydrolase [Bacteroidetes bacterium GWB2_32_14]OFX69330.1 MAG: bifunctional 5,10-